MTTNAWLDFPSISALNAGRDTRDAHDRLTSNLTAMFGTTPNEFLTTSNVEFASVTATGTITANLFSGAGTSLTFGSGFDPTFGDVTAATFTGDGSALTGIASGTGGVINTGSTTIGADSDANGSGVVAIQTRGATRIAVANLGDIGIGTDVPQVLTHLESNNPILRMSDSTAATLQEVVARLEWYQENNTARAGFIGFASAGDGDLTINNEAGGNTIFTGVNNGFGTVLPTAKVHIDQSSGTGAIPVLTLDQADVSEEMIEFVSTAGVGNAIEAVGAKVLTTTVYLKATVNGATVYLQAGTIA